MPVTEAPTPVPTGPPSQQPFPGGAPGALEHLHLHLRRTHWETKHHPNLGVHLQDALDLLDGEGWEVVTAFTINISPEIILRRTRPV